MAGCTTDCVIEPMFKDGSLWCDIMEAEETGDPLELEKLKRTTYTGSSSQDESESPVKKAATVGLTPSPATRRPLLPLQCHTPKQDVRFSDSHSYTSPRSVSEPRLLSYADVLRPSGKRGVDDRQCLSPVEGPTKKQLTFGSPQFTHTDELQSNHTPGCVERTHKLPQRKLSFVPKSQLSEEEPMPLGNAAKEKETDQHRLEQRQKQIDFGKNTVGYGTYSVSVPRDLRDRKCHPVTPDKNSKCSKRSWDGQVRKWRRALHTYDPTDSGSSSVNVEEAEFAGIDLDMDVGLEV